MKKNITIFIFIFILTTLYYAQEVNGDTLTVEGKKILKVWGTHYERGYATGDYRAAHPGAAAQGQDG